MRIHPVGVYSSTRAEHVGDDDVIILGCPTCDPQMKAMGLPGAVLFQARYYKGGIEGAPEGTGALILFCGKCNGSVALIPVAAVDFDHADIHLDELGNAQSIAVGSGEHLPRPAPEIAEQPQPPNVIPFPGGNR